MLTITNSQFIDSETFEAKFLVDIADYETLEKKVLEDYIKNVEVAGFRKGKAPRGKALLKADPLQIQEMVYNQCLQSNYAKAIELATEAMNKDGERAILNVNLVQKADAVGLDNKGFFYSMMFNLTPNIDLSYISKLNVAKVHVENLPGYITFEEFRKNQEGFYLNAFGEYEETETTVNANSRVICDLIETNLGTKDVNPTTDNTVQLGIKYYPDVFESNIVGLKVGENKLFEFDTKGKDGQKISLKIDITVKKVLNNTTKTVAELIEKSDNIKNSFPTIEDFITAIQGDYDKDKANNEHKFQTRAILDAVVKNASKIEIDEEIVTKEVERISEQLTSNEEDPVEAFNNLGFLFSSRATTKTLKQEIENYIRGEFTLEKILFAVYLTQVAEKITSEEIESNYNAVKENPAQYQFPVGSTGEDLRNQIFDRIMRNKSQNWVTSKVTIK